MLSRLPNHIHKIEFTMDCFILCALCKLSDVDDDESDIILRNPKAILFDREVQVLQRLRLR